MPSREPEDDPPIVKLVNMAILNMLKKELSMLRVRVDGPTEYWTDGVWVTEFDPPEKLRPAMIDRIKEMALIDDDAPLRFEAKIRLHLGKARKVDLDVLYSQSEGGGVAVVTVHDVRPDRLPSNEDVMRKAEILVSHATDAIPREDARARLREAVERVQNQAAHPWFLRFVARTAADIGLYDDALEYLATAQELLAGEPTSLLDVEVQKGAVFAETNRLKEARSAFERALAIAEGLPRPNFYEVWAQFHLAQLALDRGDVAEAEATLARVDAIIETLLGPKTAARLIARAAQIGVLRERGDAAGAETLAVASLREAEERGLVSEAEALREQLAEIALARGDAKAAIEHLREVLQLPSRSPKRARTYATLARAQRAVGRDADAISSLRAAGALADGALGPDHPVRIEVERDLATLTATAPYR